MPKVRVLIDGLPPKKDGANSMWNKPLEQSRIIALRRAVSDAMAASERATSAVALRLLVRSEPRDGDLDNFLTGICDALMPASSAVRAHLRDMDWSETPDHLRPIRPVLFDDDAIVQRMSAERLHPLHGKREYILELTWDEPEASFPLPPG